jgi:hypothetical protein
MEIKQMPKSITKRPAPVEYDPFYDTYIRLVPPGNLIQTLSEQKDDAVRLLRSISEEKSMHRYAPGKWSSKEVVGHMCDTERIMAYRALRIARGDQTPLPGFEQDDYIRAANFDSIPMSDLAGEFQLIREATFPLLRGFDEKALERRGTANNVSISVLALAYIIAGHERHHVGILRSRYLRK